MMGAGKRKRARNGILAVIVLLCLGGAAGNVEAAAETEQDIDAEMEETMEGYLDELDFSEIDKMLNGQEGTDELDFRELVERMLDGEEIDKGWLFEKIFSAVFSEVREFRGTLIQIIILCIVFAILYNFANVFENPAVTDISF